MARRGRLRYLLWIAVAAMIGGILGGDVMASGAQTVVPAAATPPCPFIIASSPQTLSTNPPPVPLNPCPGVVAGTYFGGQSWDKAKGVAVDAFGNAYVVGWTNSTDFPTTADAYDATYNGNRDLFVAKFNQQGGLVYSTLLGGSGDDSTAFAGRGIALDPLGNVYVTGWTTSSDFPTTLGAYDEAYDGRYREPDAFVAKFGLTGSLVYSTLLGGPDHDVARSIALDASGHAYVTGETWSSDFPITPEAYLFESEVGRRYQNGVFVVKFNPEGTDLVYSSAIYGRYWEQAWAIAVDAGGNALVAGQIVNVEDGDPNNDFPTTPGAFDSTPNGAFVFKLNPEGTGLVFSTFLGGNCYDQPFGIVVDSGGNSHVTGGTCSTDFPTTPGAYDRTLSNGENDNYDAFVLGFDPTGALLYSTFLGGTGPEVAFAISLDEPDFVHVTGGTSSDDFPTTPGAFDATFNGFADVFVAKLERDGSGLNYSTFLGGGDDVIFDPYVHRAGCQGACEEAGWALAVDPTGNTTVVGITPVADFPATTNAFDTTLNGEDDAFLVRIELIPEPNRAPIAYFDVVTSPDDSLVLVDATGSADAEDRDDLLEVRWDWGDDRVWDTGWSSVKTASHEYSAAGVHTIRLEVRDTGGLTSLLKNQVTLVDSMKPAVTISSPSNGAYPTTATVTIKGTASDNFGVQEVELSTDGTTWSLASGTTSWSGTLSLAEGQNTIYARATDPSGNIATATISVTVRTPGPNFFTLGLAAGALVGIAAVGVLLYRKLRSRERRPGA